jgi:hypothetical protein
MNLPKSENFLQGISDYYFSDTRKDKRNKPPRWMQFKLHQKEWQDGWDYAKNQEI